MKKWVAAPFSAKIEKMTALGPPFSPKVPFLVDFGVPWGSQKSSPRGESHWGKPIFVIPWEHYWPQITFFSILAPILGASGPHFGSLRASFWEKMWSISNLCIGFPHCLVGWLVGLIGLLGLLGWLGWKVGWALGWIGWSIGLVKWKDSKNREDDPTTHNPMDVARRNARSD